MKIKILKDIPTGLFGLMVTLRKGEVTAVEEEIAHKLVEKGYADYEI
jgi:hypothetical protein